MKRNKSQQQMFSVGDLFTEEIRAKLVETKLIWLWVAFFGVTVAILFLSALGGTRSLQVGDIAPETLIYEGSSFSYTSDVAYDKAVAEIESGVNDVYTLDDTKIENINAQIDDFINKMVAIKSEADPSGESAVSIYKGLFGDGDSAAIYAAALNELSLNEITDVAIALRSYFVSSYAEGIKDSDMESFMDDLYAWIEDGFSENEHIAAQALVSTLAIEANYVLDEVETAAVTAKRIAEIQPEEVTIRSGQRIVEEGTEVTAEQMEALQKSGMLNEGKGFFYFLGVLLFTLFLYFMFFLYCKRYYPFYAFEREGILLVGFTFTGFLLVCQIIMALVVSTSGTLNSVLGYLLPLSAVAMIFTALTNQRLAFVATAFAAIFMFLLLMAQPSYFIVACGSALFTVYSVGRVRERFHMISFGFYIGLLNILLILIVGLVGEQSFRTILIGCGVGFFGGLISAFIALGTIPFLENFLKMATPMKLMELSSTGHPLIKRLMAEAPGTYYHSILVANLAEAAADAIGADALLARVASYYHDIGKLERPAYFTENQEAGENPHDKISPAMSTLIIVSHVKDGIEMAKEYGLPDDVVNIITEHHGDGVLKYFYHKAKESGNDNISKEDFSYPFPRPRSRESAIVMMADCVQATLQSMPNLSKGETVAKIHSIIQEKQADGQFAKCDLTFKDLSVIQDAFVSVYEGMAHHRVKYPDLKALAKKTGIKVDIPETAEESKEEKE
ncbi:MAG: HDIG domain-containing protein [Firmicutes bacterium]|nr:HDIG domain-containing protein [Bacillota bacterium]